MTPAIPVFPKELQSTLSLMTILFRATPQGGCRGFIWGEMDCVLLLVEEVQGVVFLCILSISFKGLLILLVPNGPNDGPHGYVPTVRGPPAGNGKGVLMFEDAFSVLGGLILVKPLEEESPN
ncbi:hypothetical protein AMTR_s00015p00105730 [Amborella trichopoda]|uniref:Uncharacterized protein n=1 Tax=Amborella trichopoda TaxID=13333 RepID=W1PFT6_AMBTC|nr:hypothetical protein AMTR_s00015p00105730 [Amborella trichopoda]